MKISKLLLITVLGSTAFVTQALQASVLTLAGGPKADNGVNIAVSAKGTIEGRAISVNHVSEGLRSKVVVFPIKIYVAQMLVSDTSKYSCSANALISVGSMPQSALVATFLHQVTSDQLVTSFKDSFASNNVDVANASVKAFLDNVAASGPILNNQIFTIVGENLPDRTEAVTFEGASGGPKTVHGGKGFINSIFSIWLGNPADNELAKLKSQLTTCGAN